MKKILLSALAILPLATFAQQPFTINGDIKGLKTGDKIYLVYQGTTSNVADSAMVTNGMFTFKGVITDPAQGNLFLNLNPYVKRPAEGQKLDVLGFYLEPGVLKLTAKDSLKNVSITGSVINDDSKTLKALTKPVTDKIDAINQEYAGYTADQKKDKALIATLGARYDTETAKSTPIVTDFIKKYPNSYIALTSVSQLAGDPDQMAEAEKLFDGLSPTLKTSSLGKKVSDVFQIGKKTSVGVVAMDFTQNDVNDKPFTLSSLRGKYVLLDFWASWCGPCRQENPNVVAAFNKYKDKGFTVLGVSLDRPGKKEAWLKAIADDKLAWTQVSDLKFWDNDVAKMYGVRSIPANFLIDPSGKIVASNLREEALQNKLEELLGSKSK